MMYDDSTTVDDALAAWDRGDSIWSVSMGGIGPGYEQCIQVLIVELLRAKRAEPLPTEREAWSTWGDDVVARLDKDLGFSGAQVGAAKSAAARMLKVGYGVALGEMKTQDPDRLIQVSNKWPRVTVIA